MKKKSYLIMGLAAILPVMTSCSSDDNVSGDSEKALSKLSVSASINTSGSRVELSDNGQGLGLKEDWSTSDAFLAQDGTGTPTILTKSAKITDQKASFIGELYAGVGDKLYGYYPSTLSVTSGTSKTLVNYSMQGGTLAKVQNQAIMTAYTTVENGVVTNFPFSNATAILRIYVKLPVTVATQITKLTISGSELNSKKYITLSEGTSTWADGKLGDIVVLPNPANSTDNGMTDANGETKFYVAMIPQQLSSGFTVTAQTIDNKTYSYTVGSAAFSVSNIHSVDAAKTAWTEGSAINTKTGTLWDGLFYCWDAPVGTTYSTTSNANTSILNASPSTDEINVAQACCKNCPTYKQICMYLGAGAYKDTFTKWTSASGKSYTGGRWFKKACYITGFAEGTAPTATTISYTATLSSTSSPDYATVVSSGQYFFLPLTGFQNGGLASDGEGGYFWSNTPTDTSKAYILYCGVTQAVVCPYTRSDGFCLWSVQ